jgi:hypothetical protein
MFILRPFIRHYLNDFFKVYDYLVIQTGIEHEQLLIEQANALSHLAQLFNRDINIQKQSENINKAYNHISRATLDAHKLLWAHNKTFLAETILGDKWKRYCYRDQFIIIASEYLKFIEISREARLYELKNIGVNTSSSIAKYHEANELAQSIISRYDATQEPRIKMTRYAIAMVLFLIGIAVPFITASIVQFLKTSGA